MTDQPQKPERVSDETVALYADMDMKHCTPEERCLHRMARELREWRAQEKQHDSQVDIWQCRCDACSEWRHRHKKMTESREQSIGSGNKLRMSHD